jgi:hypothetical protein
MPVIVVTWETEIGMIMVGGQPGKIVCKTSSWKQSGQNGLEVWSSGWSSISFTNMKSWVQTPQEGKRGEGGEKAEDHQFQDYMLWVKYNHKLSVLILRSEKENCVCWAMVEQCYLKMKDKSIIVVIVITKANSRWL